VISPLHAGLLVAAKSIFRRANVTSWYFYFVKELWKVATRLKLVKKNLIRHTKKVIRALKVLSLTPYHKVEAKFASLRRKVTSLILKNWSRYEDFFKYVECHFIVKEVDDGIKRGHCNIFPIKFWNFLKHSKSIKLTTLMNMGAEDFTTTQNKFFSSSLKTVDSLVSNFRDLEATKKIEFEELPRDSCFVDKYEVEVQEDLMEWERRVGTETAFWISCLKKHKSVLGVTGEEIDPFYVSETELLTCEDYEDEPPQNPSKTNEKVEEIANFTAGNMKNENKSTAVNKTQTKKVAEDKEKKKAKEEKQASKQLTPPDQDQTKEKARKRGRKHKYDFTEKPPNQPTISSFPAAPKAPPVAPKPMLSPSMNIEEIWEFFKIQECLPKLEEQQVTAENLFWLTMDDLKSIGIPIGPARQIVTECSKLNQLANPIPNASNLEKFSYSAENQIMKAKIELPMRKRGAKKKLEETKEQKRERLKELRRKKREEKEKEKEREWKALLKEAEDKWRKVFFSDPKSSILNHLVPKTPTCPALEQQKKEGKAPCGKVDDEIKNLVTAKPQEATKEPKEKVEEQEESESSELDSDEPFI
jgi:hypothetical protein